MTQQKIVEINALLYMFVLYMLITSVNRFTNFAWNGAGDLKGWITNQNEAILDSVEFL